ncbi:aldehyde dehydrogenase family protein [Actinophytocola sp.]|uniref:aldehyde dehydrogenase family protein n=1 Tax=Actinophytocola sp. TaxID=1872138 RepID=UPI003D6BB610
MADIAEDIADRKWQLFYGGDWQPAQGGDVLPVHTPIDGSRLATVPVADVTDVARAVAAARDAAVPWGRTGPGQRIKTLRRVIDKVAGSVEELAWLDTLNVGIPISAMRQEVAKTLEILDYYAGIGHEVKGVHHASTPDLVAYTRREPYGVVGQIYPFNHPLMFTLLGLAPALLAGNGVVVKPADQAPLSSLALAELLADVLPPGLFNVVPGTGPGTGGALCAHPDVPRIAFTGSVAGGRSVLRAAAEGVKHVSLELGGKNPLLVLPDADVDMAVAIAVRGMNLRGGAGQSCQSNSRVLVHAAVADRFVDALVDAFDVIKVGDPRHEATEMGPLAFPAHYERVRSYIEVGGAEGATLRYGGGRPAGVDDRGCYLEPTVFTDVRPGMRIADEEIFGPVVVVVGVASEEEMVEIANSLPFGLNARIVGGSATATMPLVERLEAGTVWFNESNRRPPGMPMGGHKQSGLGNQLGVGELLSYTQEKAVVLRV